MGQLNDVIATQIMGELDGMTRQIDDATKLLTSTTHAVYELVSKTPKLLQAADERLDASLQKCVDALETVHAELIKTQTEFLQTFIVEKAEIERSRLYAQELLLQAQAEKIEFKKLSFLGRIFYSPKSESGR